MSKITFPARLAILAACGVFTLGTLAACGSDNDTGSGDSSSSTTQAPEDVKVPLREVINTLPGLVATAQQLDAAAQQGDFDSALSHYDELHGQWEDVEGTVKDTDRDAYEEIETAQGLIKDGAENDNAERVKRGVDDQAKAISGFIADHG